MRAGLVQSLPLLPVTSASRSVSGRAHHLFRQRGRRVSPVEHSNLKEIMSELFSLLTSIDTGRGMLRDALGSSSSMRLAGDPQCA
jgi:hypothetical protein